MKEATADETRKRRPRAASVPAGQRAVATPTPAALDQRALLSALKAVAAGDFSVRLPGDWTGLDGKIADTFNEIVAANQKMAEELERVGQVVGKRRQDAPALRVRPHRRRLGRDGGVGQHADRRPAPARPPK